MVEPTGAVSPDGTTKLVWDSAANGLGALAATTSADRVIRTMAYDTLSRPTSATWEIEDEFYTGEQTYDGFGRLYTVTYPDTPGWTRFKDRVPVRWQRGSAFLDGCPVGRGAGAAVLESR